MELATASSLRRVNVASPCTQRATSLGSAGLPSTVVNGPSVSVSNRAEGSERTRDDRFSLLSISLLIEK